jgi:hypothetical protein
VTLRTDVIPLLYTLSCLYKELAPIVAWCGIDPIYMAEVSSSAVPAGHPSASHGLDVASRGRQREGKAPMVDASPAQAAPHELHPVA